MQEHRWLETKLFRVICLRNLWARESRRSGSFAFAILEMMLVSLDADYSALYRSEPEGCAKPRYNERTG